jgi:hypothetical protein
MKKFIIVCLLIVLPLLLRAGSFDIALNLGIVKNTAPTGYGIGTAKGGKSSVAGSFKLMYNFNKHWQIGMSVGYMPLSYITRGGQIYFDYIAPNTGEVFEYQHYVANPALPVMLEANHTFSLGKFEIYSGVSAGIFAVLQPVYGGFLNEGYPYGPFGVRGGLVGGMQAGGNWFFVPWCALNMQMSMHYYEAYELMAFPVTAGVHFRL